MGVLPLPRQTLAPRSTTVRALHSIGFAMSRLPAHPRNRKTPRRGLKMRCILWSWRSLFHRRAEQGEETANARPGQAERAPAWWEGQTRRGSFLSWVGSEVEIEEELVGDRPQVHRGQLAFAFVGDPGLDNVLGEHVALEKEFMVTFQGVEHLAQRARGAPDLLGFLGLEVVQVLVDRIAWVDLVLDAIQSGHEHGGEGEVGVAGRIRAAELDPLRLRALGVDRDPHGRRAVALGVNQVDRSFVAWYQPAVRVGGRSAESQQGRSVLEQAADVVAGHLADLAIALLVPEQVRLALPEALVAVHARAVVTENRLGHEGHDLPMLARDVAEDVLVIHEAVCQLGQWAEPHVDLGLTGRTDLVMMDLDRHADLLQGQNHLGAQVLELVGRRAGEVTFLVPQLVAQVGALLTSRIPDSLDGVNVVIPCLG